MQNSKVLKLFYGKCCLFPPTKKKHNTFFFFIYSFSGLCSLLESFLFVKFLPRRKKKKFPWKQEQDWKIVNHNKHEGKKSGWKKAEVIVWLQKKEGKTFQDNDDNETLKKKFKTKLFCCIFFIKLLIIIIMSIVVVDMETRKEKKK